MDRIKRKTYRQKSGGGGQYQIRRDQPDILKGFQNAERQRENKNRRKRRQQSDLHFAPSGRLQRMDGNAGERKFRAVVFPVEFFAKLDNRTEDGRQSLDVERVGPGQFERKQQMPHAVFFRRQNVPFHLPAAETARQRFDEIIEKAERIVVEREKRRNRRDRAGENRSCQGARFQPFPVALRHQRTSESAVEFKNFRQPSVLHAETQRFRKIAVERNGEFIGECQRLVEGPGRNEHLNPRRRLPADGFGQRKRIPSDKIFQRGFEFRRLGVKNRRRRDGDGQRKQPEPHRKAHSPPFHSA